MHENDCFNNIVIPWNCFEISTVNDLEHELAGSLFLHSAGNKKHKKVQKEQKKSQKKCQKKTMAIWVTIYLTSYVPYCII